jgi:NAD(P)-dependent dehydrogenase (short-subunit alcohol dehydrogenase family)
MMSEKRVAIISGASQGIGYACAQYLGLSGMIVVIVARNDSNLEQAHQNLEKLGITHHCVSCDLAKPEATKHVIRETIDIFNRIDVLVNNVGGVAKAGKFEELSDQDWIDSFNLNCMSVVRFCRDALPYLRKSSQARIINISSFVAKQPGLFNPHYSASKAAILNLTKHLANTLAADGILVNSVSPGNIHTEYWDAYISEAARQEQQLLEVIQERENRRVTEPTPLKRLGKPEEIAALVHFLASSQSSFITGENFTVDGGRTKTI